MCNPPIRRVWDVSATYIHRAGRPHVCTL